MSQISREEKLKELERQLAEANDTIDAIRTGQIDALVVNHDTGPFLYTLQSADHSYRIFVEKMAEGALILNTDGLIVYSNSKFASMVNRALTNVIGNSFYQFISPEDKAILQQLFIRRWEDSVKSEIFLSGDNVRIAVQLSISSLFINGVTSLSVIVTDMTTQMEHQKELKEKNDLLVTLNESLSNSNHDLQQFASVASHDLQEPLRKIQVFSKFLKDRNYELLPEQSKSHLEKIIRSSGRMKTLIVDILTYSRLSSGDTIFEKVDLRVLFNEIIDDFDLKISEKEAEIEIGSLPMVEVSKGQIRQVFTNLISNALKFSKPGVKPRILIQEKQINANELGLSLLDKDAYCRISIMDNGIGFDEKFSDTIFSLFEKLNPKSSFEGSGIGLAIAKKIVDKHHGIIIARSKLGEGAEFNIILPRHRWHNGN